MIILILLFVGLFFISFLCDDFEIKITKKGKLKIYLIDYDEEDYTDTDTYEDDDWY